MEGIWRGFGGDLEEIIRRLLMNKIPRSPVRSFPARSGNQDSVELIPRASRKGTNRRARVYTLEVHEVFVDSW